MKLEIVLKLFIFPPAVFIFIETDSNRFKLHYWMLIGMDIKGFALGTDTITFDGYTATAGNFHSTGGTSSTLTSLYNKLAADLSGSNIFAFEKFNETTNGVDVNHDGTLGTVGVLAMDANHTGITEVIFLDGVSSLSYSQI